MHELSEMLEGLMEKMYEYDKDCYKKYEMKLYKMAYGSTLSRRMAEEIVNNMRPYRMRWSMEETQRIQDEYGLNNIRPTDFFVVILFAPEFASGAYICPVYLLYLVHILLRFLGPSELLVQI